VQQALEALKAFPFLAVFLKTQRQFNNSST
jgi:hypothetical protein